VPCGEKAEEYRRGKKKQRVGKKRCKGKEVEEGDQHLQFSIAPPLASPLVPEQQALHQSVRLSQSQQRFYEWVDMTLSLLLMKREIYVSREF